MDKVRGIGIGVVFVVCVLAGGVCGSGFAGEVSDAEFFKLLGKYVEMLDTCQMQMTEEEVENFIEGMPEGDRIETEYFIGVAYLGKKDTEGSLERGAEMIFNAYEKGYAEAEGMAGFLYCYGIGKGYHPEKGERLLKTAANKGKLVAQWMLGNLYYAGNDQGVGLEQDYAEAVKYYEMAAEQGDLFSQAKLGDMYFNGDGVGKDYAEAAKWLRKPAEENYNVEVLGELGIIYYMGSNNLEQDYKEAIKWLELSAEQGFLQAQFIVGAAYLDGLGVEKDYQKAREWE